MNVGNQFNRLSLSCWISIPSCTERTKLVKKHYSFKRRSCLSNVLFCRFQCLARHFYCQEIKHWNAHSIDSFSTHDDYKAEPRVVFCNENMFATCIESGKKSIGNDAVLSLPTVWGYQTNSIKLQFLFGSRNLVWVWQMDQGKYSSDSEYIQNELQNLVVRTIENGLFVDVT